jgi:2-hydroxy-6-oxo-octa-2,4-dienoate hydrolase
MRSIAMPQYVRWNSQPLESWADKYARGKFIDLSGHKTHYIEAGQGKPVILLHGFFYDSYLWAANIDALAERFKVYALDLWGFGYSTRTALDYGYQLYADQVSLFMDSLSIQHATLVGQSMGGGTAIQFCVQHPQRVDKLLLVAPAGMPNPLPLTGKFFNLPGIGEFFMGLNTDKIRKKNLGDFWIHNKQLITDSYFENVTRFQKVRGTTEISLSILRKEFFHTLRNEIERLAQIEIPILIIWGREDRSIPVSRGQEMHRILDGSRLEILNEAGHVPNYEQAALFNQLALDFLQA